MSKKASEVEAQVHNVLSKVEKLRTAYNERQKVSVYEWWNYCFLIKITMENDYCKFSRSSRRLYWSQSQSDSTLIGYGSYQICLCRVWLIQGFFEVGLYYSTQIAIIRCPVRLIGLSKVRNARVRLIHENLQYAHNYKFHNYEIFPKPCSCRQGQVTLSIMNWILSLVANNL